MNAVEQTIRHTLESVIPEGETASVVDLGWAISIQEDRGNVAIVLEPPCPVDAVLLEATRRACEETVSLLENVKTCRVVATLPTTQPPAPQSGITPSFKNRTHPPTPKRIQGITHIIAVASGKGGVGKSTVASNLAVALAGLGQQVGLVDADIYGPSVARMMGMQGEPDVAENRIIAPLHHGVKCMSMGAILGEDTPAVWRGPMVSKALHQLMLGVDWGNLDILVIDLPPGTGDIHLSIAQNFVLDGVVIVSTPQHIALMDVQKAISMFQKLETPILGMVENMAYFEDENGKRHFMFGESGVESAAQRTGVPLISTIAVIQEISVAGDTGRPITLERPDSAAARSFIRLAEIVKEHFYAQAA